MTISTLSEHGNLWHHCRGACATADASLDARGDRKLAKCIATNPGICGGWLYPRGGIDERQKPLQCFGRINVERPCHIDELDDA